MYLMKQKYSLYTPSLEKFKPINYLHTCKYASNVPMHKKYDRRNSAGRFELCQTELIRRDTIKNEVKVGPIFTKSHYAHLAPNDMVGVVLDRIIPDLVR